MSDAAEDEVLDIGELDPEAWADYAEEQGWSDGLPLVPPTEPAVARMLEACRGDNEPFPPITPRQVVPTVRSLAANAVMAGCRPEYFPVVLAALRGVLAPEYNLHGTLATTHSCAPMLLVNGPLRHALGINCGSNCFGENQEESPWVPYHVRRGFDAEDSVVTVMSAEPNHNLNDHGSTTGEGLLTTFAGAIASPAANTIYAKGPYFVAFGPEHAATLGRDGWTVEAVQQFLHDRARVPVLQVSRENRAIYEESGHTAQDGFYKVAPAPQDIHVLVAGGPGKHSAWIPSFGGTAAVSVRVKPP